MTIVLITGANRGLGLEMTRRFSERAGVSVIACCRAPDEANELVALSRFKRGLTIEMLDVADVDSVAGLKARLGAVPIDILINNAGIFGKNPPATSGFSDQVFGNSDFENDWILPFRVNAIGPMQMVEQFSENVASSVQKKIVIITSIVGSIETARGDMFGYAASKAAANMTAKNLSISLKNKDIIVNPIHPGYAKTDMGGDGAHVEVADAVSGVIDQIDRMTLAASGSFLSFDNRQLPW